MSDDKPPPPKRAATVATSSQTTDPLPSAAAVRHRLPQRQSSPGVSQSPKPALGRRRSSIFSYSSFEGVTTALTDDIINPSMSRPRVGGDEEEVTHWHSTPLAFAILPAVGGLLFKNGSAFITDILLLAVAAIFMNWSIRLPWDWYYSAQLQRRDVEFDAHGNLEEEIDEAAVESASSAGGSPKPTARLSAVPETETETETTPQEIESREAAAAELRRLELLALLATFVFPILAAYLLHIIRAQLSPSSTGLVSDYNLTIFLLVAELRPSRQLIRLITNRTLHLQRTATGLKDPFSTPHPRNPSEEEISQALTTLQSRLTDLEAKLPSPSPTPTTTSTPPEKTPLAQKSDIADLSTDLRKRYEPRLEGLERAVRRYEKRSVTLAMVTEQRLASLEARLQDALSLAAVAAQQSQTRSAFGRLLDHFAGAVLWPARVVRGVLAAPVWVLEEVYRRVRVLLFGGRVGARTANGAVAARGVAKAGAGKEERLKERNLTRKIVR